MIPVDKLIAAYRQSEKPQEKYIQFFETRVKELEAGLAAKHIWNQDFEDIKYSLNRLCEDVLNSLTRQYFDESIRDKHIPNDDVRQGIHYWFTPMHSRGYLAKAQKAEKKFPSPVLTQIIPVLAEMADLYDKVKAGKAFIVKGRKPNPNRVEPDMSHTGECCICRRDQKLAAGNKMVHHGFEISNKGGQYFGYRLGKCFGTGYQPYELSCECNKVYLVGLQETLVAHEENLKKLQGGKEVLIKEVQERKGFGDYVTKKITFNPGEKGYKEYLQICIARAERDISYIKMEIKEQENYIAKWVAKPLPHGGHKASLLQFGKV